MFSAEVVSNSKVISCLILFFSLGRQEVCPVLLQPCAMPIVLPCRLSSNQGWLELLVVLEDSIQGRVAVILQWPML